MSVSDKYDRLNAAERDFLFWHPLAAISFNENATAALEQAQKRFGPSTLHNGSGDAFRHCFWSAMNARDEGVDVARQFGEAHEAFAGNPANEKKMDLHNNGVGFKIGEGKFGVSNHYLAALCVEAWAGSKLVQIDPGNATDLIYSNSYEKMTY
jgi:hypothetical protein